MSGGVPSPDTRDARGHGVGYKEVMVTDAVKVYPKPAIFGMQRD